MDTIRWLPAKGYERQYEVSDSGEIRSLHKRNYKKLLKLRVDRGGYIAARLSKDGKTNTVWVHRLVGLTFIENLENKPHINHKDCNKQNNHYTNLEWVTHSENIQHAYDNGRMDANKGKNHHFAVVVMCIESGEIFYTLRDASKKLKVNYGKLRYQLDHNPEFGLIRISTVSD